MAINPSLLIAAPMLQNYLVDKNGLPLSAGIITLFSETQRSILKNWYMQQGTNPPYSYVPLPNPMTLSAAGTIQDADGNDVIPYFYPYENDNVTFDSYYITVQNSDLELQFTRSNFPFVSAPSSSSAIDTNDNLLINNCFWRNVQNISLLPGNISGTISINSINYNFWTLAPSQHDGHIMPDINYFKNSTDGTEVLTFPTFVSNFPDNVLVDDVTPEFYMNINCTSQGSATTRYLQIPLSLHIDSLSGFVKNTFTVQAMSVDNNSESLTVGVYQFCGTGVTTPPIAQKTFILSSGWNKFSINLPIPSAQGVTTGSGGDDALYIQIGLPTTSSFNVNIALPSFYLSNTPATNSFQTYDEVNSIVSSPRTGDVRVSANAFVPFGYVPMNDGILSLNSPSGGGLNLPISRIGSDTWPLYNLTWNLAKPADQSTQSICPMYNITTGSPVAFGSSAYGDFTNSRGLSLTKAFGRVILGTAPSSQLYNSSSGNPSNIVYAQQVSSWSNVGGLLAVNFSTGLNLYIGQPITFIGNTLPANVISGHVYYAACPANQNINGNTFLLANTSNDAIYRNSGTYLPFNASGGGAIGYLGLVGTNGGEYSHSQTIGELVQHQHNITSYNAGNNAGIGRSNLSNPLVQTTDFAGSSLSSNIAQTSTYYNMFMKL